MLLPVPRPTRGGPDQETPQGIRRMFHRDYVDSWTETQMQRGGLSANARGYRQLSRTCHAVTWHNPLSLPLGTKVGNYNCNWLRPSFCLLVEWWLITEIKLNWGTEKLLFSICGLGHVLSSSMGPWVLWLQNLLISLYQEKAALLAPDFDIVWSNCYHWIQVKPIWGQFPHIISIQFNEILVSILLRQTTRDLS